MMTLTVNCSVCSTEHSVALEEQQIRQGTSFNLDCSSGEHKFAVVIPPVEDLTSSAAPNENKTESDEIDAELVNTTEVDNPPSPYSGSDSAVDIEQCLDATISINKQDYPFRFWYTPDHEYHPYVVRVKLTSGAKRKNAYVFRNDPYADELAYTDRGVPKDSDKNWTYLSLAECKRRAEIAGLAGAESAADIEETEINPDRTWVWLGEKQRAPMNDGSPEEELLLKLAKGLIVFQTDKF